MQVKAFFFQNIGEQSAATYMMTNSTLGIWIQSYRGFYWGFYNFEFTWVIMYVEQGIEMNETYYYILFDDTNVLLLRN